MERDVLGKNAPSALEQPQNQAIFTKRGLGEKRVGPSLFV
jgi:hypothetical protein